MLDPSCETALCRQLVCQRAFGLETWQFEFGAQSGFPARIDQILPGGLYSSICVMSHGTGCADPVCAGNIGQALFTDFRITFDYPNRRIALAT